jgi:hypothetical protein
MFFEQQLKWILILCLFLSTFQAIAQSNKPIQLGLHAQPNKCVALNQGRKCFANVLIDWQLESENDYCLLIKHTDGKLTELKCWEQTNSGQLSFEFQSTRDLQLLLTRSADNEIVASESIQVSWLYQASTRKRRWRLF